MVQLGKIDDATEEMAKNAGSFAQAAKQMRRNEQKKSGFLGGLFG